jgi:hypothetical protein
LADAVRAKLHTGDAGKKYFNGVIVTGGEVSSPAAEAWETPFPVTKKYATLCGLAGLLNANGQPVALVTSPVTSQAQSHKGTRSLMAEAAHSRIPVQDS